MTRIAVLLQTGGWRLVRWTVEILAIAVAWLAVLANQDNAQSAACPSGDCSAHLHPALAIIVTVVVVTMEVTIMVRSRSDDRKRCPECAETIRQDALVCKHCGYRQPTAIGDVAG